MPSDPGRSDPLRDTLGHLVDEGTLSTGQAGRVEEALRGAGLGGTPGGTAVGGDSVGGEPDRRERVVEVLAYLGGALVLGALVLIVSLAWDDLDKLGKLAICGGATILLLGAAVAVARTGAGERRRRTLAPTLAALGSAGAALTAGVALGVDRFGDLVVPGLVMLVVAAAGFVVWRGAPLACALFGGGLVVVVGVLGSLPPLWQLSVVIGATLAVYGGTWVGLGRTRALAEPQVLGVLGGATSAVGAEIASVTDDYAVVGLLLGLLVIAGMFALFWTERRWWYAVLGAATALVVPPTALGVIWDNALVVGVVLLVVGVALILGAVLAVRRRGK